MAKSDNTPYLVKVPGREAWHIRDGKKRKTTGETSLPKATSFLVGYIEKTRGSAIADGRIETVGGVLDHWIQIKKPGLEANGHWQKKWRFVIGTIRRHANDVPLETAGFKWSRSYVDARKFEGVKGPTIRQELSTIRAAWRLAFDHEETNIRIKAMDLPQPSKPREKWLTRDEAGRMIDELNHPHLKLFTELALSTAGRHTAIIELKWHQIHFDKKCVDLRVSEDDAEVKGKKKRRAMVPVSDRIIDLLKEAKKRSTIDQVIEFRGKSQKSCLTGVASAAERAGIPGRVTPHILRHTAATWMCNAGVNLWEIAGFMGHSSTKQVEETYGHHSPDHMSKARDALML
jgi:integrase